MSDAERAAAVRRGVGLFRRGSRALLEVRGADRVRWLDGMLSNEIARLRPDPQHSGCRAFMLSPQGRILAEFHVLDRGESLWLETEADGFDAIRTRLERYVIADDVRLEPIGARFARLALEGPAAPALLTRALGRAPALAPECGADFELAGAPLVAVASGWSGAPAFQLYVPGDAADAVVAALRAAAEPGTLCEGDEAVLEILRIEAGVPRQGRELTEKVLPPELGAWMPRAVSTTKGCYTGQEIVARLLSRGAERHRLVALRFGAEPAAPGTELRAAGKVVGEVTSSARSQQAGAIGLGFVTRPWDAPGSALELAGDRAEVVTAPHVPLTAARE